MKDKFIKVVVTDLLGNEAEDETLTKVGVDASFDVELVDDYGLQSDGTGIIGDQLTVTYGATFGVPQNITWYKDGKVVLTRSIGDTVTAALTRTITASAWGTGVYKVTITNTDGDMAETNEITITDKEQPAEILDFTLEDDYTDGTDLTYGTQDTTVVATVTMSKNYAGRFSVYRATDTSFRTPLAGDRLTTDVDEPIATAAQAITAMWGTAAVPAGIADGASVLTSNAATNFQVLNAVNVGSGYGFIGADGTVTYKWVLDDTGVERGAEYVVAFDQASISTDTPGTGIANASGPATAPYIVAPSAIAVTKVAAGNQPEITFQDENGEALGWFGTGVALAATGVATANIYSATTKTTDTTASGVNPIRTGVTNRAAADTIEKGVWKSAVTASNTAFWFAKASLTKGIFGKDAIDLTADVVAVAQAVASDMTILEDKTTATSAVVDFSELRAPGTVYIVRGSFNTTSNNARTIDTDNASTLAAIYEKFDPKTTSSYEASAKVEAGAAKVTIPNAIGSFTGLNTGNVATGAGALPANYWKDGVTTALATSTTYKTDDYIAVFVPDDEENYGTIYTDGLISADSYTKNKTTAAWTRLRLTEVASSLTYNKTAGAATLSNANVLTMTSTGLIANNQFGSVMRSEQALTDVTSVAVTDKDLTTAERATAQFSVANDASGQVTVVLTTAGRTDQGDGYTLTVAGSTITLSAMNIIAATTARNATQSNTDWQIKVGSDNFLNNAEAVTLAGLTVTFGDVNTTAGTQEITIGGTNAVTITAADTAGNQSKYSTAVTGRVVTVTWVGAGAETVTITIAGTAYTRTLTVSYASATSAAGMTTGTITANAIS